MSYKYEQCSNVTSTLKDAITKVNSTTQYVNQNNTDFLLFHGLFHLCIYQVTNGKIEMEKELLSP